MEKKRDLYSIYLDLNYAINCNSLAGTLGKAHDIAQYYNELSEFINKMDTEDATSILEYIEHAIEIYKAYDELTDKIYRLSSKYDK